MENILTFIKKYRLWFILAAVLVATLILDLVTKHIFEARDAEGKSDSIVIIEGLLELRYVRNYGASFGMFFGESTLFLIMTICGIPFFCGFLYYSRKNHIFGNIGLALIISGSLGNAVDRLINSSKGFFDGYVRDFIDMHFFICNIADVCMSIGVAMLIFAILFLDKPKKNTSEEISKPENG